MEEFKISLGAELKVGELDNIRNQLNNIQTNPIKLTIDTSNVQSQINSIKKQIQSLSDIKITLNSGSSGATTIQRTTTDIKELYSLAKQMSKMEIKIGKLDGSKNANEIKVLETQLNSLRETYDKLIASFNFNDANLTAGQLSKLNQVFNDTENQLSQLEAKFADTKAKLASEITVKLNTNEFKNEVTTLESKFNKLEVKSTEVTDSMQKVKTAFSNMEIALKSGNVDTIVSSYERYKTILQETDNQISISIKRQKELADARKLSDDTKNLSLGMDVWLKENSAAASQFGARIKQLQVELKTCDATRFSGIKSEFQKIKKEAELAGKATQTFNDRFKTQFSKLTTYFSASMLITQSITALRSMYNNVVEIDTAMTELKKVTNETDSAYSNFLKNASSEAKKLGTTIDNYVSSTADFARLGHTFNDSQVLAKTANVYAVVGDEIDSIDTATQSIISTMTAFDVKVEDSMSIADKFNKVGNEFAISSGGIGEALTRSASSMAAANNTLDQTIALITAANTVVQDPDSVGKRLADNKSGYIG